MAATPFCSRPTSSSLTGRAAGLDVQIDRGDGSGETCKRVALGQYDYALADFATMVKLADHGLPLTCIGMVATSPSSGYSSLQDSKITKPGDLEGKTSAPPPAAPMTRRGRALFQRPALTPTK